MNKILASREHYTNAIVRTLAKKNGREERSWTDGIGSAVLAGSKKHEWSELLEEYRKFFNK